MPPTDFGWGRVVGWLVRSVVFCRPSISGMPPPPPNISAIWKCHVGGWGQGRVRVVWVRGLGSVGDGLEVCQTGTYYDIYMRRDGEEVGGSNGDCSCCCRAECDWWMIVDYSSGYFSESSLCSSYHGSTHLLVKVFAQLKRARARARVCAVLRREHAARAGNARPKRRCLCLHVAVASTAVPTAFPFLYTRASGGVV